LAELENAKEFGRLGERGNVSQDCLAFQTSDTSMTIIELESPHYTNDSFGIHIYVGGFFVVVCCCRDWATCPGSSSRRGAAIICKDITLKQLRNTDLAKLQ